MARADATLNEGSLITKSEALDRLARVGVPRELADEVRNRRLGPPVWSGPWHRLRRGRQARRITGAFIHDHVGATRPV